ncbi:hypothetical protein Dda_5094 [Drechslerella dactyloides]|uniref:HMG box domain-containing protein n=1 Tax=Drechslerella dactyloides TaxID=74499 RepID=A0AAD6IW63_DREDA|nr:hypothetical protein Dda_5094 [Drechslerella dactyloides]
MPSTRRSYLQSINGTKPSPSSASPAPPAPSSTPSTQPASHQPSPEHHAQRNPLHQQWEFAAVWEFLFQFHQGLKSPYYTDIEQFAHDLSTTSGTQLLHDVQIGLLKNVSSQRGLTIDMFDDYTRRQYLAKKPDANPFGSDILPASFYSLLPEERVRVLHQLCMWILSKPEAFRDKVDPHKIADQTDWRIDPIGWDSKGTSFYQFDNGYLYCRTEPLPPVYQKWKSRKHAAGRSAKRRKVSDLDDDGDGQETALSMNENDIFTSQIEWKCVCSNLQEYRAFVAKLEKSKHPDEKELRKVIVEDILPVFEKEEQKRKRKLLEEEKELARLQLLSGRKRSARVDERMARQREAEEKEHVLRNQREEIEHLQREEMQKQKEEEARIAKLEERERRLQERELRAKQRQEEKARLLDPDATESEDSKSHASRKSSRQKEKRKAELEVEDKDWIFDCICGIHGVNYDDGTHSIACDKCGVWQHTRCIRPPIPAAKEGTVGLGAGPQEWEEEFICDRCRDKENAKKLTPIKIKLRLTRPTSSEGEGDGNGLRNAGPHSDPKEASNSNPANSGNPPTGNIAPSLETAAKPHTSTEQSTGFAEPLLITAAQEPPRSSPEEPLQKLPCELPQELLQEDTTRSDSTPNGTSHTISSTATSQPSFTIDPPQAEAPSATDLDLSAEKPLSSSREVWGKPPTSCGSSVPYKRYSPARVTIEAPPTPTSFTEGPVARNTGEAATQPRSNKRSNSDTKSPAQLEKESPKLESRADNKSKPPKKRKPAAASKAEKPKVPKLDKPLSELTKDYMDLPIRDMERWVHRSVEERRKEVAKRDGHVARPMNSFMLYRSAFAERTKMWCLQNNHQVVSSVSGASWPLEPAWIRERYNELARIERINHQAAHPGYKFSPSKNQPPPPRRRKTSSDAEDETELYSTDVDDDSEDREPEPILIPQPVPAKKQSSRQRPKSGETKKRPPPLEEAAVAKRLLAVSHEQPLDMNMNTGMNMNLKFQTGAQKSSYEALNPGRPPPVSMTSADMSGTYYETVVRPTASAGAGNAMIEDVTVRKTAAPTATMSISIKQALEARPKQEEHLYSSPGQQQQQQQRLSQEPPAPPKQDPSAMEQNFCVYSQEPTPEVDFEHYRGLLEQQVMQNIAAQQAYLLGRGAGNVQPSYGFVPPGLAYVYPTPVGSYSSTDGGDVNMTGIVNYDETGGPMWHSADGNGNVYQGELQPHPQLHPQNGFQYDEWLAE